MKLLWGLVVAALLTSPLRAQHTLTYRPGIDVLDYEFALRLPARGPTLDGVARVIFRRTRPTDTLILDLVGMQVNGVTLNGSPAPFRRDSTTVRVALRAAKGNNPEDTVTVAYSGAPSDGLIIRTDSLGRYTAFGDNWPTRARYWLPTVDDPSDKATVTWRVLAPPGRRIVANGELIEENPKAAVVLPDSTVLALTVWRESRPIPVYLMVIAAAPLAYYDLGVSACGHSESGGCVRQSVYHAPEQRRMVPGPFVKADEIVGFFATLIAPFPYEKLAHLQSSTKFGGMENASAIFYSDKQFREGTMRPGLIAHEVAHQWFGDAVTPHRWADLWLSEGFASYFEQLWVERFTGDSARRDGMSRMREQIVSSSDVASRPVVDSAETNYLELLNANSYQKGAWSLHMLRRTVGDSAFIRGVRAYYNAHRHSTATTDDLRQALERESGQELGWFFHQWLERPGFPEITTSWEYVPSTKRVRVRVRQGERFGAYRFPLVVEVRTKSGVKTEKVEITAQRDTTVDLAGSFTERPTAVRFDPGVDLLAAFRQ